LFNENCSMFQYIIRVISYLSWVRYRCGGSSVRLFVIGWLLIASHGAKLLGILTRFQRRLS
jgi:hypothetical protein